MQLVGRLVCLDSGNDVTHAVPIYEEEALHYQCL